MSQIVTGAIDEQHEIRKGGARWEGGAVAHFEHGRGMTVEDNLMNGFKILALAAGAGICFAATTPKTQAQVGVEIGVAPVCPYGYYDVPPYDCAPYGYYGPEWFVGGVFIGAGPWFHGPANFRGHVNNHFHPEHGYNGPRPNRGDKPEPGKPLDKIAHFKGNEVRDGRGHAVGGKR